MAYHLNQQLLCLVAAGPKMQLACPPCGASLPEVQQACGGAWLMQELALLFLKSCGGWYQPAHTSNEPGTDTWLPIAFCQRQKAR